jgi:hypothetical protein
VRCGKTVPFGWPHCCGSNQILGALSLEKHPDKTFIGRIERGFDFLGCHFSPAGVVVAKQTIANFIEKASRLYEQERRAVSAATALEMYVRRWLGWANGVQRSGVSRQQHPAGKRDLARVQHTRSVDTMFTVLSG